MIALALLLVGCGPSKTPALPQTMSVSPNTNVHLRNAFDMDPSAYLGRFVPDGKQQLDEAAAMPLTCSQHISHRRVEGGGVRMTELLEISADASARLGIPLVANASGETYGFVDMMDLCAFMLAKVASSFRIQTTDPGALAMRLGKVSDEKAEWYNTDVKEVMNMSGRNPWRPMYVTRMRMHVCIALVQPPSVRY